MMKSLRLIILGFISLLLSFFLIVYLTLGFSPRYLYHATGLAAGIGAKLVCSIHYVSGFSRSLAERDVAIYSPILSKLNYRYVDGEKRIYADIAGFAGNSATYRKGMGCYLDYAGYDQRSSLVLARSPAIQAPWPLGDSVNTIAPKVQNMLQSMLTEDTYADYDSRALLVVKNGVILAEAYADGVTPQTPLLGWSMAKSVTGLMLGALAKQKSIDVSRSTLFSEWSQDERKSISLQSLLQMTDGLRFNEDYIPGGDAVSMLFKQPEVSRFALNKVSDSAVGEHFNYSSGSTNLLSRFLTQHFDHDVQKTLDWIWQGFLIPMGISQAELELDASGYAVGSSSFFATAREWARFGELMLKNGVINGKQIVSKEWVQASVEPNNSQNDRAYGYQWWLNSGNKEKRWKALPDDAFAARGNRKQWLLVVPSEQLVIVRLGWSSGDYPHELRFSKIIDAVSQY